MSVSWATARTLARALPDVEESTAYGSPALKVRGRMFAVVPTHRSADPDSLAIRMDFEQRDALIADDPATYYLREHYVDYPVVLVRLNRISREALRELLQIGWKFEAAKLRRRRAITTKATMRRKATKG